MTPPGPSAPPTEQIPDAGGELSTQPVAAPASPPNAGIRPLRILLDAWRQLTSMRTALLLLFLLAVAAVPGSVLPQRGLNPLKVADYYAEHPKLAPVLDRLSLFDVFAAPWFGAVYLLLFVSLAGCVIPRVGRHAAALRARPPHAPRHLRRLPVFATWGVDASPPDAAAAVQRFLAGRRWRTELREEPSGAVTVAAEKGYARETGNLVFHLSLLVLLVGVAMGGLYGYKATVLVEEGDGFSNTLTSYDNYKPGRLFDERRLRPFTVQLDRFSATYQPNGQPNTFSADVTYESGDAPGQHRQQIRVNHPLEVNGSKVYLIGHGYAPVVRVTGRDGTVVMEEAVPFLPQDGNFTSTGAIAVPDARPEQLGFTGFLTPTTIRTGMGLESGFPGLRKPQLTLAAYRGDTGQDRGVPASVYTLDTSRMTQIAESKSLAPGETWQLPGGAGSITYVDTREWATFQVTRDPGTGTALAASVLMVTGLVLSLTVRRRRVWVRATAQPGDGPRRTVVAAGGLARSDAGTFPDEFGKLSGELAAAALAASTPDAGPHRPSPHRPSPS